MWANYSAKDASRIKPFRNITRPINGDWLFASNGVKQAGKAIDDPYGRRVIQYLASRAEPCAWHMLSLTHRSPRTRALTLPAPEARRTSRPSGGLCSLSMAARDELAGSKDRSEHACMASASTTAHSSLMKKCHGGVVDPRAPRPKVMPSGRRRCTRAFTFAAAAGNTVGLPKLITETG